MRFLRSFLLVILALVFASGIALADEGEGQLPVAAANVQPWTYQLGPIFESASTTYQVPLPLLLALAHFGSAFENRGDAPTIESGYGVMALRQNSFGGTSLAEAAALLTLEAAAAGLPPVTEEDLKVKADVNIMGAAAVLDSYAKMWQVDRSAGLDAWLNVIIKYAALDPATDAVPVYSRFFAMEIYEKLKNGMDTVNSSGERFSLAPLSIGSISLPSLEPPGARVNAGYSGATWYPAASCNYSAYYTAKNTVVCHTIEGTASGCLGWFRNCNAQVSAHYVVSEAGGVWQCVDENYRAWHVGCANNYSLGIEHEGYAGSASHPASLYNASALLTRDMCNRWGITKQHRTCPPGILGHNDINNCVCGGSHWDPGGGWNWTYYINQVNGGTPPPPPPPSYAATYHAQSYPATMTAGTTAIAWAEYTNTGTATWGHAGTKLGTQGPQDRSSPFYNAGNWDTAARPSVVDQSSVATGAVGRFTFILKAPSTPGVYVEKYRPVQEGVTWFGSDVTWTITVTASLGNITGTVRNSYNSQPIVGATVAITSGPSTTTNGSGVYTFTGLAPATYTLNVSKAGFGSTSGTAGVTAGVTTTKDFTLTWTDTTPPSTPTGLAATSISPSQINLSWNASTDTGGSGLAGYIIYRGGAEVGRTAATTYSDNGLAANTAYTYTVKAYDNAGYVSAASSPASATTQPGTVPIFEDGFVDTSYWQNIVQSPMPGAYPPSLVADHDHSQFTGINSLMTLSSTDPNQGCLIGHTFGPAFAVAKFESYFFDGTGLGYLGDFDAGTEGWASYPSAYVTLSSVAGGSSGNCLQVLDHGWTGGFYKEFGSGFAVGDAYTFSLSTKVPTVAAWGTAPYVFVRFRDGGGATIGTQNTVAINADNNWHVYTLTGTVPAGTVTIWVGEYMYLNATADYNSYVDWATLTTSASIHNSSRQGLQVRSHGTDGSLRAIYYIGTYSAAPGSWDTYSAGYYKLGTAGWIWNGAVAPRSIGWHKFTIDVQPYTGAGNEVKFLIDGTQVAQVERTLDTQTYGMDMVAYGFHYRVNYSGWFDDCAMYASAPVAPTMGTPVALSDTAIRWNLTDNSNNEIGFKVQDAAQATVASAGVSNSTGGAVSADETGLAPNTPYTRFAKAFNGTLDSSPTGNATRWTLSAAPTASNVTCDKPVGWSSDATFTFTAVGGFGEGTLAKYLYAWDTNPTHTWTGTEAVWNSGELILSAPSEGSYYLHVKGYNGENAANGTLDVGPYNYQAEPPTNPTAAVETHGAQDEVWQSTIGGPSFTWSGASASSGIAGYLVYFGDDSVGTSTELVTSAAYTPSAVTTGTYYLRLCTQDSVGSLADEWATLFTFKYDSSAPDAPTVTDDGDFTGSKTKLHAIWTAADPDSGIAECQYAVGTSVGATDVVGWTSALTATEADIVIPDPGLTTGQSYYISAKAKNGAGVWSDSGSSDGIALAPAYETIADAKALADTTPVALSNKIVTASFAASFYMEEANRTSGIMVFAPGYGVGALVTVGGTMGENAVGERAILDPVITLEAAPLASRIPTPFLMTSFALGGGDWQYDPVTGAGQQGVYGLKWVKGVGYQWMKIGLNNIGLLVKVCGLVESVSDTEITISDGSSIKILRAGINVPVLTTADFVSVVGISSIELDTLHKSVVRLMDENGIVKLN